MMVIAMITAASSQASAIQIPPVTTQRTFRIRLSNDIRHLTLRVPRPIW